ncbi:hypothetical protein [Spirosoma linguale]|uniref:hypothetical protein n=1 Tax=Spirosoma linguale TaxID=108 RepID=UPI0002D58989
MIAADLSFFRSLNPFEPVDGFIEEEKAADSRYDEKQDGTHIDWSKLLNSRYRYAKK